MNRNEAIEAYAQAMYKQECKYWQEHYPERYAKATPEQHAASLEHFRKQGEQTAEQIDNPVLFAPRIVNGALHPDNKHTRTLFTRLTGISLDNTARGVYLTIEGTAYGDAVTAYHQQRQEEEQAEQQRIEEERRRKYVAHIDRITECVRRNEPITGDELVDLCRHHNILLHPRSIGMWRERIVGINKDSCRLMTAKGQSTDCSRAYAAYRDLLEIICPPENTITQEQANHLFGVK